MTNTLHRQGTLENLKNDYVVFVHLAKGFNYEGSASKIREFIRICLKHHPVNTGFVKEGNIFQEDFHLQKVISTLQDGTIVAAVFNDLDILEKLNFSLIVIESGFKVARIAKLLVGS